MGFNPAIADVGAGSRPPDTAWFSSFLLLSTRALPCENFRKVFREVFDVAPKAVEKCAWSSEGWRSMFSLACETSDKSGPSME